MQKLVIFVVRPQFASTPDNKSILDKLKLRLNLKCILILGRRATTPKSPSKLKSSKTGWASYLSEGLTLHIDQVGKRECAMPIPYLSYDPFCRPESLVQSVDAVVSSGGSAIAVPTTPRKSMISPMTITTGILLTRGIADCPSSTGFPS